MCMDTKFYYPPCCVDCSLVRSAADDCGVDAAIAADVISMVVNLRTNAEILSFLRHKYGVKGKGHGMIRVINPLIKSFILFNYEKEFTQFCSAHRVSLFDSDLESQKRNSSHARMMCVVFLRETLSEQKAAPAVDE